MPPTLSLTTALGPLAHNARSPVRSSPQTCIPHPNQAAGKKRKRAEQQQQQRQRQPSPSDDESEEDDEDAEDDEDDEDDEDESEDGLEGGQDDGESSEESEDEDAPLPGAESGACFGKALILLVIAATGTVAVLTTCFLHNSPLIRLLLQLLPTASYSPCVEPSC